MVAALSCLLMDQCMELVHENSFLLKACVADIHTLNTLFEVENSILGYYNRNMNEI
jgi:hypothetical protein